MTQRDRQPSGGVFGGAPPPAAGPGPTAPCAAPWEELFTSATPAQQQELLDLARRQGVLYAHQLPAATNGSGDRPRPLLGRLLAGPPRDIEPVRAAAIVVQDTDLDEAQRDAVAKALATPDVCLIQGLPGTGKSRVVAEVVTQAAARGERVLLLAPTAAPVDRVLEAVADRPALCPLRCLGRDESAEALSAAVRGLTLLERLHRLRDETLPRARAEVATADDRLRRVRQDEALWPVLRDLAGRFQDLAGRRGDLDAARVGMDGDVDRAAEAIEAAGPDRAAGDPLAAGLRAAALVRDRELARLADDMAKAQARTTELGQEEGALRTELEALAPLAEARRHRRLWTAAWWRAVFGQDVLGRAAELEVGLARVRTEGEALAHQKQDLEADQDRVRKQYAAERARLVEEERRRRHEELNAREAAFCHDEQLLHGKWQAACKQLQTEACRDMAPTAAGVEEARAVWQQAVLEGEERGAFARQWAGCLEEAADTFPQRLLGLCNLAAATLAGLASDPYLAETSAGRTPFDLLVLEGADQVTEAELLAAARRARRWVLVGQPVAAGGSPAAHWATGGPPVATAGVFQRLWQHLHCDPRRLPYAWVQEETGLCCRLRPLTPDQGQWVESEPLADSPDIVLRILTAPRSEPQLAEVVFPASMSIQQAKEYIFHELQELPVCAAGRGLRWVEDADRIVLRLGDGPSPGAAPVALEPGVREMLLPPAGLTPWRTCCVEFERGAGWHRLRAEAWVEQHLGLRDLGRTARLDVPYRMHPDLARFLSELLFEGEYRLPAQAAEETALPAGALAVAFVPVPAAHEAVRPSAGAVHAGHRAHHGRGRGTAVHTAQPPRRGGGAGLEVDLADPRHRDRLPGEFRAVLPDAGLVNYLEAQAVVQALEGLAADPAVRAARPSVGVIALYAGQAALIRRLLQQSPAADLGATVDVPDAFAEREHTIALVSLTRSHGHRAVPFGDGPHALALALTRARARLVVFGDVGTLARRCQWPNPLAPLDEAASARERLVIGRLVAHAQGTAAALVPLPGR